MSQRLLYPKSTNIGELILSANINIIELKEEAKEKVLLGLRTTAPKVLKNEDLLSKILQEIKVNITSLDQSIIDELSNDELAIIAVDNNCIITKCFYQNCNRINFGKGYFTPSDTMLQYLKNYYLDSSYTSSYCGSCLSDMSQIKTNHPREEEE